MSLKFKVQTSKFKVSEGYQPPTSNPQPLFFNPQSAIRNLQLSEGFSLLDLLIALLVLTVVLLAAVKQFGAYEQPAVQPPPQVGSPPARP